ncbi:hypothetical protein BDM02DRAFT_3127410 [Thelephora ganbajun]|uniref:Uncharacterized protein n=1 Tax=Thelephora ganbajun TaxID=370292 RepID=A0ACB6ZN12_THEGA|nr:hypothetical protein BDM02DRAFT_3127410 [Thelephora ganbajun]
MAPPFSPTTSIESTVSLVTPNHSEASIFVDDCAGSEGVFDGHLMLFKNSEVWEEFKDSGCGPLSIPVPDTGIPVSPSSSLLSGIDLLEDTALLLLPEVTAAPIRSESHLVAVPRRASLFDFPSPPILVSNPRTTTKEPRPTSGSPPTVSLVSYPCLGTSHGCISQPNRHSQSNALQRWSTLPPTVFYRDKRRGSSELVTSKATGPGTFKTRAIESAVTCKNPHVVPALPFATTSPFSPRVAGYDLSSPVRGSRRQETSDLFTSFIDMSVPEPAFSKSRVHKLFSQISGSLWPRSKRH